MIIYSQKYFDKYNQITKYYKNLDLKKSKDLYTENHHILPKSMGGDNSKDNLVRVPARVHFLLHWMLYRIYRTPAMAFAWTRMMTIDGHHIRYTSKSFEYARIADSRERSILYTGRTHSNETKLKMSIKSAGRSHTQESKLKMSIAQRALNKTCTESNKLKYSLLYTGKPSVNKGRKYSSEVKEKMSQIYLNRPKVQCPHCTVIGAISLMKRWHFDNCKSLC